jgi:hypothetical protein
MGYGYNRDGGTPYRTDGRDPVTASASAEAHGRIGLVAWARFKKADGGQVLTFDKQGQQFSIEVDTDAEKQAFMAFAGDLLAAVGRMTP